MRSVSDWLHWPGSRHIVKLSLRRLLRFGGVGGVGGVGDLGGVWALFVCLVFVRITQPNRPEINNFLSQSTRFSSFTK